MSLLQNAESGQWQNYLDLQNEVKPYLQINDSFNDVMLQMYVDSICTWIQKRLGRPIAPTTFDRRFNGWSGWNGAYLQLPFYPVLEIISVTEWWGVSGPHVLSEQTPTNQSAQDSFQCDYLRGMLIRTFPGLVQRPWFPGSRNIEVTWKAGFNPIPADIKLASLELIAHWWRNTQQASRSWSPAGTEYDPSNEIPGMWAGLPHRIADIIDQYQQVGLG